VVAIRSREPPDVEELPDPGLVGQVTHRARQETALQAGDMGDVGKHLHDHVADFAVSLDSRGAVRSL
jgi:hypothetical protein